MNGEQAEGYIDDELADAVAELLDATYDIDPANIPDHIFDRYPDIAADLLADRFPAGAPKPIPAELTTSLAESIAAIVAREVREAEADTATLYTVWDVPATADRPRVVATDLTCSEAMSLRAEREEADSSLEESLLIYPNGQAWWE